VDQEISSVGTAVVKVHAIYVAGKKVKFNSQMITLAELTWTSFGRRPQHI
jgi:hypothetical protein